MLYGQSIKRDLKGNLRSGITVRTRHPRNHLRSSRPQSPSPTQPLAQLKATITWAAAEKQCSKFGGHLASINSATEFVIKSLSSVFLYLLCATLMPFVVCVCAHCDRYSTVTSVAERSCRVCPHCVPTKPRARTLPRPMACLGVHLSDCLAILLFGSCTRLQGSFFIGMVEDKGANNHFSVGRKHMN